MSHFKVSLILQSHDQLFVNHMSQEQVRCFDYNDNGLKLLMEEPFDKIILESSTEIHFVLVITNLYYVEFTLLGHPLQNAYMFGHKYGECIDRHALLGCGINEKNHRFKELNVFAKN